MRTEKHKPYNLDWDVSKYLVDFIFTEGIFQSPKHTGNRERWERGGKKGRRPADREEDRTHLL